MISHENVLTLEAHNFLNIGDKKIWGFFIHLKLKKEGHNFTMLVIFMNV